MTNDAMTQRMTNLYKHAAPNGAVSSCLMVNMRASWPCLWSLVILLFLTAQTSGPRR